MGGKCHTPEGHCPITQASSPSCFTWVDFVTVWEEGVSYFMLCPLKGVSEQDVDAAAW